MSEKDARMTQAPATSAHAPQRGALGRAVRNLRTARRMSQEALAECVGDNMSQGDVSRLEVGRVSLPGEARLQGLARCLHTTPGELLAIANYPGLLPEKSDAPPEAEPALRLVARYYRHLTARGMLTSESVRELRRIADWAEREWGGSESA